MPSATGRLAGSLLAAITASSCALGGSPPSGLVVVTSSGSALTDGADDVAPTLDLRVTGAPDAALRLDGAALPAMPSGSDLVASVRPLPLGSAHHLEISAPGRPTQGLGFRIIGPTGVVAAVHQAGGRPVADLVFEHQPDRRAVAQAVAPAAVEWSDDTHLRLSWTAVPPAPVSLSPGIAAWHGSHLAGTLHIDPGSGGALRRTSVPSAPAPRPTRVTGYSVGTGPSRASVAAHVSRLDVLAPAGWRVTRDGRLTGEPDPPAVAAARAAHVAIWPLVQNDATDADGASALLGDADASARLIAAIAGGVAAGGYAGVHLDLEGVPPADRDRLTGFVRRLAAALHARGARLAVDVIPHRQDHLNRFSGAYDDPALAGAADLMALLAYDQHTASSEPGPVAGLDWQAQVLDGTLPGLDRARALLGIPLYGRTWEGDQSSPVSYADIVATALAHDGARVDYDFAAATPSISWRDPGGGFSTAYFDDADSIARKLALAREHGLGGVACWRLGFEDPAFWEVLRPA